MSELLDKTKGSVNQAVGSTKRAQGKVTGDARLQARGTVQDAKGRLMKSPPISKAQHTVDTTEAAGRSVQLRAPPPRQSMHPSLKGADGVQVGLASKDP